MKAIKLRGRERAIAIDVYRELRRSRDYVGRLEKTREGFRFAYSENYLLKENALSLGPDLLYVQNLFYPKTCLSLLRIDFLPDKIPPIPNTANTATFPQKKKILLSF